MVSLEIIKEWIAKADEDFEFAKINLEEEKSFFPQICFHFHQAVDKYLKAYIIANKLEFRKIHDLPLLLKQCSSQDASFNNFSNECQFLSTFYIETRYPVHWPVHLSKTEAKKPIKLQNISVHLLRISYKIPVDRSLHASDCLFNE